MQFGLALTGGHGPVSARATKVARRLCAQAGVTAGLPPDDVVAAAGRLSTQLRVGLGRSIGREGFRAVFERAMSQLQADDEPLVALGILRGDEEAKPTGPGQAHGAAGVAAGMVALVATVIDLLGGIVGEAVALRLVEDAGAPVPHGVADPEILGGHDGKEGIAQDHSTEAPVAEGA